MSYNHHSLYGFQAFCTTKVVIKSNLSAGIRYNESNSRIFSTDIFIFS